MRWFIKNINEYLSTKVIKLLKLFHINYAKKILRKCTCFYPKLKKYDKVIQYA